MRASGYVYDRRYAAAAANDHLGIAWRPLPAQPGDAIADPFDANHKRRRGVTQPLRRRVGPHIADGLFLANAFGVVAGSLVLIQGSRTRTRTQVQKTTGEQVQPEVQMIAMIDGPAGARQRRRVQIGRIDEIDRGEDGQRRADRQQQHACTEHDRAQQLTATSHAAVRQHQLRQIVRYASSIDRVTPGASIRAD